MASLASKMLADPATSHWLNAAIKASLERDPVDALIDAEALVLVLRENLDSISKGGKRDAP